MSQERRVFLSVELPEDCFPEIDKLLGGEATWLPGSGMEMHPQLRMSPDWPVKDCWRAYAPLLTKRWIYEFVDPDGRLLVLPPKRDGVIARLAELRARFPQAVISLHVINFLCEGDTLSGAFLSPEVMPALAAAGVTFEVSTHYDLAAEQ